MTLLHQAAQKAVEARQGFEEWMLRVHPQHSLERTNYPGDHGEGDYVEGRTHDKWQTWQSALQQQEVPREPVAVPIPLDDAQMLLAWMDETFGNDSGTDWNDADAAAVGDALDAAIENFKRMRSALAASPSTTQQQEVGSEPGWFLPDSAINDLQQASVQKLWAHAKRARWTNAVVRKDAVKHTYEADWIKHMHRVPAAPSTPESAEKDDAAGVVTGGEGQR